MENSLILLSLLVILSVLLSKLSTTWGLPIPLIFLLVGLVLGSDGLKVVDFNSAPIASEIALGALAIIMFHVGFSINLKYAKPVFKIGTVLSVLGTIFTALIIATFAHFVLKFTPEQGFLIGAVIAPTDAASVFSIFKSRELSLKNNLDSLIEVESSSNDPVAAIMTAIGIALLSTSGHQIDIPVYIIQQIVFGVIIGLVVPYLLMIIIERISLDIDGLYSIFILAIVVLTYALTTSVNGNGFIAVYLGGLVLNNSKRMPYKRSLVHFFDGISWLMQMSMFLTLGLLASPHEFVNIVGISVVISIFVIMVARPIVIFVIMMFTKFKVKEKILVSFAGIRGAVSIVFATNALVLNTEFSRDLFNIIFFLVLISVLVQGGLLPILAEKLKLVEKEADGLKSFSDYENEKTQLMEVVVNKKSPYYDKKLIDVTFEGESRVLMIKRKGNIIVPRGRTRIRDKDILVLTYCPEDV